MEPLEDLEGYGSGLLAAIISAMPEPLFVLDRLGNYLAVLGGGDTGRYHDGSSLVGKRLHDVLPADVADQFVAKIDEVLATGDVSRYQYQLAVDDVDGVEGRPGLENRLSFEGHIAPVRSSGEGEDMVVWMAFNITRLQKALDELEAKSEELERLARTDDLTGLANRRRFFEALDHEVARVRRSGRPASVVVFDLDNFKHINDSWGHLAGDAALVAVADVFRSQARTSDVAARLGGEEFALLLTDTDLETAVQATERVRGLVAERIIAVGDDQFSVTTSCGVAEMNADDADAGDVMRRADRALYAAKDGGRNRVEVAR